MLEISWISFHKTRAKFLWGLGCVYLHKKLATPVQCIENMLRSRYQHVILKLQSLKLYCDVHICKLCVCIHIYIHKQYPSCC